MEWQPIETAPKDGTCIIALIEGVAIEAFWNGVTWIAGVVSSHGCGCCGDRDDPPTHWMPLPPPPKH